MNVAVQFLALRSRSCCSWSKGQGKKPRATTSCAATSRGYVGRARSASNDFFPLLGHPVERWREAPYYAVRPLPPSGHPLDRIVGTRPHELEVLPVYVLGVNASTGEVLVAEAEWRLLSVDLTFAKEESDRVWTSPCASPRIGECHTYIERWETLEAIGR